MVVVGVGSLDKGGLRDRVRRVVGIALAAQADEAKERCEAELAEQAASSYAA